MKYLFSFFISILILNSCKSKVIKPSLFSLLDSTATGINFRNDIKDSKDDNSFYFRNFYNGGGVALGDINNDGLPDVLLTSNQSDNKLYLNKGNFTFQDITSSAGMFQDSMWSTGATMVDINADGWLDIYVCNSGHMKDGRRTNKLYINNRNNTFKESGAEYGLNISGYSTQASFFDYDGDGDLDCFLINNSPMPINTLNNANRRDLADAQWPVPDFLKGGGDHLYRNDDGKFIDVTSKAGIHGSLISFGLGVSVADLNDDGYLDVYVGNDSYEKDYLYINQKNGTFRDELEQRMQSISMSSMGTDVADLNNDGHPEVFTTDMLPENDFRLKTLGSFDNIDFYKRKVRSGFYHQFMKNCLQFNNRDGTFSETGNYSGISATDWSWGELLFDADNDGLTDIYVCNGVNKDVTNLDFMDFFANEVIQKMVVTGEKETIEGVLQNIPINPMLNKAYKNKGNAMFDDAGVNWGFTQPSFSNGAAYADLDKDGDLDLVVNNVNQQAFIYKNNSNQLGQNNFLKFSLKGKGKNTFAIGSKIIVYKGKEVLSRELIPSRGFQASVDYKQIIGLGKMTKIDSLIVIWPDRTYSKYLNPRINAELTIDQNTTKSFQWRAKQKDSTSALLIALPSDFEKHKEDDYIDYYYERNVPELISRDGPSAAVGDVNGDKLDDVYIGGAAGQAGQLYMQNGAGGFTKKEQKVFKDFASAEDVDVLMFDADGDKDLDLAIAPGGNKFLPGSVELELRLYKNDGKGNFTIDPAAFLNNAANLSVIVSEDFDKDGDLDLFVGGRSMPRNYGAKPSSYLLVNDGNGHFKDIAFEKNREISQIGMVTNAVWADVTGDKNNDLIIVGGWMPPRIFSFTGDRFVEINSNLANMYGWWKDVIVTDVNKDGRTDLVLGNIGENFYLKPDSLNPVRIWINDFNNNGSINKVLTRTINGKDRPVFLKAEMQDEIPSIKKENLKHANYASKTIQELFKPELLNKSVIEKFNYSSSCIAINIGNGQFKIQKLPYMTQLSSADAIVAMDLNNDSYDDLVVGGNQSLFPPQFGCLDASYGSVLINNKRGGYISLDAIQSGLSISGEIRNITPISSAKHKALLFLRNDNIPLLYKVKNK